MRPLPCAFAALLLSAASILAAPTYTLTDLGARLDPADMNNAGDVVGNLPTPGNHPHAFLYRAGKLTDLGTLGGRQSLALGISDTGTIVGTSELAAEDPRVPTPFHKQASIAFIDSDGTLRPFPDPEHPFKRATAVNMDGSVACEITVQKGALWKNGTSTPLGILENSGPRTWTVPARINVHGAIVGEAKAADGQEHAFLYDQGRLTDLGTAGGRFSLAKDLNSSGTAVGRYGSPSGKIHACQWVSGTLTDLGVPAPYLESSAEGINDRGDVVVSAYSITGAQGLALFEDARAYLYRNGQWIDLTAQVDLKPSGLSHLYAPVRINRRGQILLMGMGAHEYHACVLTPIASHTPSQ